MLKKVLLLSISLGTISNSISMNSIIAENGGQNIDPINQGQGVKNNLQNNIINIDGINPRRIQVALNLLDNNSENKNYREIYNKIINNGFDNDDEDHKDLLFESAHMRLLDILKVLVNNGANVNVRDKYDGGCTLLHWASRGGHLSIVEYLVNNGANVNARNNGGYTPLHYASGEGNLSVVQYLITNDADINAEVNPFMDPEIKKKFTPLNEEAKNIFEKLTNYEKKYTPLDLAIISEHSAIVKYLEEKGAKKFSEIAKLKDARNKLADVEMFLSLLNGGFVSEELAKIIFR